MQEQIALDAPESSSTRAKSPSTTTDGAAPTSPEKEGAKAAETAPEVAPTGPPSPGTKAGEKRAAGSDPPEPAPKVAKVDLPTGLPKPGDHDWDAVTLAVEQPILVRLASAALDICMEYVFVPERNHPFSSLLEIPASAVEVSCADGKVTLTNTSDTVALYCDVTCKDERGAIVCADGGNLCLLPHEQRVIAACGVADAKVTVLNM